jgi:hypothetical protein
MRVLYSLPEKCDDTFTILQNDDELPDFNTLKPNVCMIIRNRIGIKKCEQLLAVGRHYFKILHIHNISGERLSPFIRNNVC